MVACRHAFCLQETHASTVEARPSFPVGNDIARSTVISRKHLSREEKEPGCQADLDDIQLATVDEVSNLPCTRQGLLWMDETGHGWRSDPGWRSSSPAVECTDRLTDRLLQLPKKKTRTCSSEARPTRVGHADSTALTATCRLNIKRQRESVFSLSSPADTSRSGEDLVLIGNGRGLPPVCVSPAEHTHYFPPASASCVANEIICRYAATQIVQLASSDAIHPTSGL